MTENDLLTVKEAADCLSLSRQSVYKYIKNGIVPAFTDPSNRLLIPRRYIVELLDGCLVHHDTGNTMSAAGEG